MSTLFQANARLSWSGADALAPVYTGMVQEERRRKKKQDML